MRRLLPLIATLGCTPHPEATPTVVFAGLWTTFDEMYGPFEARGVDWDEARDAWAPEVDDTVDDDALFEALTGMLEPLDDGHVRLTAPGRPQWRCNEVLREQTGYDRFDLDVVRQSYLDSAHEGPWDDYTWGTVDGDVAYLYLPWVSDNLPVIDEVLDALPDAPGLVIDLRHNGGGDSTWVFSSFGRLTAEDRLVYRSRTRNAPERGSFDEWTEWHLEPRGETWTRPVAVLTDRYTISAGERAVMALAVLPNATFVGEPTNGAQSTMVGRDLPNGWSVSVATQEVEFADGQTYEGPGMPVDVEVVNDEEDLAAGVDAALEAAIAVIRG